MGEAWKPRPSQSPTDTAPIAARLAAKGNHQLVVALPREIVAFLDELKERHGLRNRSQALLQLIEQGREAAQQ